MLQGWYNSTRLKLILTKKHSRGRLIRSLYEIRRLLTILNFLINRPRLFIIYFVYAYRFFLRRGWSLRRARRVWGVQHPAVGRRFSEFWTQTRLRIGREFECLRRAWNGSPAEQFERIPPWRCPDGHVPAQFVCPAAQHDDQLHGREDNDRAVRRLGFLMIVISATVWSGLGGLTVWEIVLL